MSRAGPGNLWQIRLAVGALPLHTCLTVRSGGRSKTRKVLALERIVDATVITVHIILSLSLIALILLHAGRGGGLSDAFGGGMGPMGGLGGSTVVERNLDRLTVIVAVMFAVTTITLAWVLAP